MVAELTEALRRRISAGRGSVAWVLTTVKMRRRSCKEAEPDSDGANAALLWGIASGATLKIARSDLPPRWALYISKTWKLGVATNLSSCARNKEWRLLMSWATLAMATLSA